MMIIVFSMITDSISILENNIKTNLNLDTGHFGSTPNQWHIDTQDEVKYDKKVLFFLTT